VPGEFHDFAPDPSEGAPNGRFLLDDLTTAYTHLSLFGTCSNALGDKNEVARRIDLKEIWELSKAAEHLMPHDYPKEIVRHLKGIENELKSATASHKSRN
jgi:hypothetical protein